MERAAHVHVECASRLSASASGNPAKRMMPALLTSASIRPSDRGGRDQRVGTRDGGDVVGVGHRGATGRGDLVDDRGGRPTSEP